MAKKYIVFLGLTVVLFGLYAYYLTDWFSPRRMQVEHSFRKSVPQGAFGRVEKADASLNLINFMFSAKYALTEVRIVPLAAYQTNKYVHPLWHLVSESNSVPVKAIVYGMPIRGMHPKVKGAEADPLEANVDYRLIVEAGGVHGEHDFKSPEAVTPVQRARPKK
jgi:hypothetical protein